MNGAISFSSIHNIRMKSCLCFALVFPFAMQAQRNPFAGARFAVQGDTGRAGFYSDGATGVSIIEFGGMLFLNDFPSGHSGLVTTAAGDTMAFARAPGVAHTTSPKMLL